ncbi:S1 family peptidase [Streptomyces sp. 6N223]|uniref:S1 family peptidase n=1 Tax=Streptomyces sp. 6N223 TaxID=3457412 RepID=UPI003FCEFE1A
MTHRRKSTRRLAIAATGIAAMVAGSFAVAQANATPTSDTTELKVLSSPEAGELAATLTDRLGSATAGSYYDAETGKLVVNVVDSSAADSVRAAGAEARMVDHTMAELNEVKAEVDEFAVPGTSWSVDPMSNSVQVKVDSTVTGEEYRQVADAVDALGDMASIERVEGEYQPFIEGGDPIYAAGARCSLGFNVTLSDGSAGFLTAGHCGNIAASWTDESGAEIGQIVDSVFPGSDYALAQYTADIDHPSAVDLYDGTFQDITEAGEAVVGQEVTRSGSTTGVFGGQVTALDVSVQYAEGTVDGTIETTVCAEPGDSGGALFAGTTALGLTSGGSGDCTAGGVTFFQPVADALAATGASLP